MFKTALLASAALVAAFSSPALAQSGLMWEPPALQNPITIRPDKDDSAHTLRANQDYIVELPKDAVKRGKLTLTGGRNIVMVGGAITVPQNSPAARAIYVKDATGIVHIEGVEIPCTPGVESDALAVNAPQAIVQLQVNRWCVRGTQNGFHGDIFQPWGGVKEFRIDRLTGFSGYQGLQVRIDLGPVGRGTISRVDLHSIDAQIPLGTRPTGGNGGYLMWLTGSNNSDCAQMYPLTLSQVYVEGRPGRNPSKTVWPDDDQPSACRSRIVGNSITFPGLPTVEGEVTVGRPLVEFVPEGVAGLNYRRAAAPVPTPEPTPEPTPDPVPVEPKVTTITVRAGETVIVKGE